MQSSISQVEALSNLIDELDKDPNQTDTTDSILGGVEETQVMKVAVVQAVPEIEDFDDNDNRNGIYWKTGHILKATTAAEMELASTGLYFQQDGVIVAVRTDPATKRSSVQPLSSTALIHALNDVASWHRFNEAKGIWIKEDAPERICTLLLKKGSYEHLPVLTGLARQPYLRLDGSVCQTPGHDQATGLYGSFDATGYTITAEPTREQAEAAMGLLQDLLVEFPFATEHDRSAAVSAMLTAALRQSLDLAPMFHVRAAQIASGKSFLCELITAFATPDRGQPVGFPNSDDECTKLLLAELLRLPAVIEFDNLTTDLKPFKSLCTVMTSERMQGRVLGQTRMVGVRTRTLMLSSGNNVGPIADMTRRCVTITLDPGCDNPASRKFSRPNLVSDVAKERGRYVSAAITVVRAWIAAGRPIADCQSIASFGQWSELCRQPLLWLGHPDPAHSIFTGLQEDPDRELLGRFLVGWRELFDERAMLVRDAVATSSVSEAKAEDLHEVFLEITDDHSRVNPRKLGHWMKRNAGRPVGGLRLVKAPKTRNAENWRVESVMSVLSKPVTAAMFGFEHQEIRKDKPANMPEFPLVA